ncbi:MAG TPA: tRNA pseudouridine(38-40) synthase TruA [Gemmatimonadetes bacterium]|nr:tRNA pseudouridine(38-40) synthase TruA [Gemmatimonadota bacterium]
MRNVRVEVAYDGSLFYGWQRQDGFESVQEAIESAVQELTGDAVTVHGAGRTDTGVHALRQIAHFHTDSALDDDRLRHALNAHLTQGVVLRRLETCREDFHSRFDACGKRYLYVTLTTRFRPAIGQAYTHWVHDPLDHAAVLDAAARFVGKHDFTAFTTSGSSVKTSVRTIQGLKLLARRESFAFVVQGDGFLYNMVRRIAGTLIDVGRGRLDPQAVTRALETGERDRTGPTAPACGLYLVRALYSEPMFPGRDAGPRGVPGLFQY